MNRVLNSYTIWVEDGAIVRNDNLGSDVEALKAIGFVIVPAKATENMAGFAQHRNPGVSRELAKGVWHSMVDEAVHGYPSKTV